MQSLKINIFLLLAFVEVLMSKSHSIKIWRLMRNKVVVSTLKVSRSKCVEVANLYDKQLEREKKLSPPIQKLVG